MIACLIQTRMKSTRLPGKCMMKISGIPMTDYLIKAIRKSCKIGFTGIIFPDTQEDKKIFYNNYLDKCFCFAGSENNVLERYYKALEYLENGIQDKIEHIVRLTSDCPLLAYNTKLIDKVIEYHLENKYDFTHNRGEYGYPSGFDIEIMKRETLEKCYNEAKTKEEKEHVTLYIKNNKDYFSIGEYNSPNKMRDVNYICNYKWSVDTKEDLEKIREFIDLYNFSIGDVFSDRNGK